MHSPRIIAGRTRSDTCLKCSWFLIGIGFLFPYNSVVTAVDFFAHIYGESIDFYLGWLLLAPSMLILCIALQYGYWGSILQRVVGTFLGSALLTVIIPLVRNVYVLFVGTFILGVLSAILQGTLFSLLGFLGSDFMSITQTGIGFSGVLVGITRIITKATIPTHIEESTYIYFSIAFVMVCVDIALYVLVLHPSHRIQKAIYLDTQKNEALHQHNSPFASPAKKRVMNASKHHEQQNVSEARGILQVGIRKGSIKNYESMSSPSSEADPINSELDSPSRSLSQDPMSLWALFCASWRCQIAVFLNYTITLSLFPGVISLMVWNDKGDEWFAVVQIFLFNLLDTIGKNMVTSPRIRGLWSHSGLLTVSVCRLSFIPLFILCVKPRVFGWPIAILINAAMGISNGLVGTSGFCLGPQSKLIPEHERGRTAQMLAVSLTSGLVGGASLAFLIAHSMEHWE